MNEETKSKIKKADTPPNQAVNELSQFLAPLAEGTLVPDYVNKLHELVQAVGEVRSGGEITLKIKISPMKGTVNQMAVHSEVVSKPPVAPKPMSLFFASENGGLHRSDPRQAVFGFDEGSGGEITLKIKISPMKGTVNQMAVHSEVVSKPPVAPKPMSLFFASENGGLHRSDPRQAVFGFDEGK